MLYMITKRAGVLNTGIIDICENYCGREFLRRTAGSGGGTGIGCRLEDEIRDNHETIERTPWRASKSRLRSVQKPLDHSDGKTAVIENE